MKKFYKIIADLIGLFHLGLLNLSVFGTLFQFFIDWYKKFHFYFLFIFLFPTLIGAPCPLTNLEKRIRKKYNPNINYKSFWQYWLKVELPRPLVLFLAILLISISLIYKFF
jgi:hypothetical protein